METPVQKTRDSMDWRNTSWTLAGVVIVILLGYMGTSWFVSYVASLDAEPVKAMQSTPTLEIKSTRTPMPPTNTPRPTIDATELASKATDAAVQSTQAASVSTIAAAESTQMEKDRLAATWTPAAIANAAMAQALEKQKEIDAQDLAKRQQEIERAQTEADMWMYATFGGLVLAFIGALVLFRWMWAAAERVQSAATSPQEAQQGDDDMPRADWVTNDSPRPLEPVQADFTAGLSDAVFAGIATPEQLAAIARRVLAGEPFIHNNFTPAKDTSKPGNLSEPRFAALQYHMEKYGLLVWNDISDHKAGTSWTQKGNTWLNKKAGATKPEPTYKSEAE